MSEEEYFSAPRDYKHDLILFARHLENNLHRAPKSIRTYVAAIVSFFQKNDIEMPRKFWKEVNVAKYTVTNDEILTKDILRSVLQHSDVCGRALFILGSSSGMRIEDVLAITVNQIQKAIESTPARLTIIQQKTRQKQVVFFSQEASQAICEWLKVRESWLQHAVEHCNTRKYMRKDADNNLLFPFHYTKANKLWNKALKEAGFEKIDENTNRRVLHIHSLRKFFRSQCTVAGVEPNVAEMFLGHIQGLATYHQYTDDYIVKQYLKLEPVIAVMVEVVENQETTHTIKVLQERIRLLEDAMRRTIIEDIEQHPECKSVWKGLIQ